MSGTRLRHLLRNKAAAGFVSGVAAAGVVGGGVALAAIPTSTSGQFVACVNNSSGYVRLIDYQAGARCGSNETTVAWSKGYRYRGVWSASSSYAALDVVLYGGSSYLAKAPSSNRAPSANPSYWGLLAARGATGATGVAPAYASYHDAEVTLPYSSQTSTPVVAGSLSLPSAGHYVVNAKAQVINNAGTGQTKAICTLHLGANFDRGRVDLTDANVSAPDQPVQFGMLPLQVVGSVSGPTTVQLRCLNHGGGFSKVSWVKITALRVSALKNTAV